VIACTAPIVKKALWHFFREKEIAILEKDFEDDGYATKSLEQICDVIFTKYSIQIDVYTLRTQLWKTQVDLMNEGLVFDPALLVLLEFCQQKNIALGIGSNSI
jgi:beta-phosphoglucomutase-like phosphatase (HAD superfamily)